MIATVFPSSACASCDEPAATTTPAPSLPTGIDWPLRDARPRNVCGGIGAVTTGLSSSPVDVAVSASAVASSSPRSDGLIGAASMRTSTSFGCGWGVSIVAMDNSSCPSAVTSDLICRIVLGTSVVIVSAPGLIGGIGTLPSVSDSDFSKEGLARLHDRMSWHVERGQMPGLISLVARNGEPHVDVVGTPSFEDSSPLRRDAIVRIASLSKPITAAVAMMLVDDGVSHLDDAVDEYLPELSDRRVLREPGAELDDTVPANRA